MFQVGYSFLDPQQLYISWVKDYLSMAPSLAQCSLSSDKTNAWTFQRLNKNVENTSTQKQKNRWYHFFNGLNMLKLWKWINFFQLNFKIIESEHGIHGRHISSTCAGGKGWMQEVFFYPPPFSSRRVFVKNPSKNCRSSLKYDIWWIANMYIIYDTYDIQRERGNMKHT